MKIYNRLTDLVGNTPLLELARYAQARNIPARLIGKLEYLNPAGSVKDRVAKAMVEDAEQRGLLKPGNVIIEPTSGNTGIGLASVAASRGYRVILTMPETMSVERRNLLKAYGAELVLTEGAKGMQGAIDKAQELAAAMPETSFIPGQFVNPVNPEAHRTSIWRDTDGTVDVFVAGVGTGGTLTGAGEYLKGKNPAIRVVAVEPAKSPVLSKDQAGPHGLQGIGAGFVPKILNTGIYDEIAAVQEKEAYEASRLVAGTEGLLVGISSGAALAAAAKLAEREAYRGKNIVVLLPDSGERYLSTPLFQDAD